MTRNETILSLEPQVHRLTHLMHRTVPHTITFDDLVGHAWIGAIQAVDRFDPNAGFRLATFADRRIKGAMLDYLRRLDICTREQRRQARLQGVPVPFSQVSYDHLEGEPRCLIEDAKDHTISVDILKLMQVLKPRERQAVKMYYWYEMSQAEIATAMGCHFSNISQVLCAAKKRMAAAA